MVALERKTSDPNRTGGVDVQGSLYPRRKVLYRLKVVVRVRIGYALQTLVNHPVENGPASIGGVTHTGLRKRELREVAVHTNGYPDYTFDREASRRLALR